MLRPENIDNFEKYFEYLSQTDWGALAFIRELIEYIEYLEAQDRRRDWPTAVHEQYLVVLDERDKLQERIDELEDLLLKQNPPRISECNHVWDATSINYGPPGGSMDILLCIECGAMKDD